ncbi:hypothetical protein B0H17DRAFT_1205068 [Mycena rosella]|uniref:MYND-type domain-containing protein n=1 Tax=Mycena rosella TaxID=1033263 RepID=A0AAD7GAG7_MYCRO|nr:hypothetical protein B0H17DRAFT_1205068 [Mycena rosella]
MSHRSPTKNLYNYTKSHCAFLKFQAISPEAAADFVASAIGNAGPDVVFPHCAQCIFGALHVVYPKDTVDAAREFTEALEGAAVPDGDIAELKPAVRMQRLQKKQFHPLWTALTRFLTVVRSDTQEITFLFGFARCYMLLRPARRHPHIARYHDIAAAVYPQIKMVDGRWVMVCIYKMLSTLNDCLAKANSVKVALNLQNSRWPTSTKDIIPYGGKITTQMFISWARYRDDLAFTAFGILGHMVKICGSLIIGDITTNPDVGEAFISTGLRMCGHATEALCLPPGRGHDTDYEDDLAVAAEFRHRATFAAVFLEAATTLAPEIFTSLIAGREAKMVQLLSLILEISHAYTISLAVDLEAQFEPFDWSVFAGWARQILADHPELQPMIGELHRDIVLSQRAIEDPLDTVHRVLAAAKSRTRCHGPGCPQSLASTGQEFKRCAACRVVAYCGKACQTRAWKSGPHAHKLICAQIKALVAKGGVLDDRVAFVRNCRAAGVSVEEALEVAKWEFNTGMAASASEGPANADSAGDFNKLFWLLNPSRHPGYAQRMERMHNYWGTREPSNGKAPESRTDHLLD